MTNVATLWIIYIIVVIVVFLILIIPQLFGLNFGIALFLALLIGAIVVFALSWTVNVNSLSTSDRTWFNILLFVAYALPLLVALIVLIILGVTMRKAACDPCKKEKKPKCLDPCEKKKPKCLDPCEKKKLKQKAEEFIEHKAEEIAEHMHGHHHGVKVSTVLACDKNTGICDKVAETVKGPNGNKVTAVYA